VLCLTGCRESVLDLHGRMLPRIALIVITSADLAIFELHDEGRRREAIAMSNWADVVVMPGSLDGIAFEIPGFAPSAVRPIASTPDSKFAMSAIAVRAGSDRGRWW
jgi:hypothetical protein